MGVSVKWIRKLIKKSSSNEPEVGGKVRRWSLWSSSTMKGCSDGPETGGFVSPFILDSEMSMGFMVLHQELAAIRIQTVFRAFLARRTLRALRALVQLQAIVRAQLVRKQATVTLRCMQARVQSQCAQSCKQDDQRQPDPVKSGSVEEVKSERAIAYTISQQQLTKTGTLTKVNKNNNTGGPNWLKGWMATKPWDPRLLGKLRTNSFDSRGRNSRVRIRCFQLSDQSVHNTKPSSYMKMMSLIKAKQVFSYSSSDQQGDKRQPDPAKKAEVLISYIQPLMCDSCDQDTSVRIGRNVSTRISPKVLMCFQPISSCSDQSVCETKPRYMKLTSSIKAK